MAPAASLTAAAVALLATAASAARVTSLPGWNGTAFDMYSGYVTVDASHGRELFYFFAEAENDPANAPLVLWLNGGPGCSSIGGGLMSELGPFYPDDEGSTLTPNPWAWNKVANMLFIESPAGVGFSYSNDKSDYTVGDARTSADLYVFLLGFLKEFPQYANTPFWVSGESYGGHYVPNLANYIAGKNAEGATPQINLQGFLVGNAWTDPQFDNYGTAFDWWTHSLISDDTFHGIARTCNFSVIGPLKEDEEETSMLATARRFLRDARTTPDTNGSCSDYTSRASQEMGVINIYEIYVDVCRSHEADRRAHANALLTAIGRAPMSDLPPSINPAGASKNYNPCIDSAVTKYLNRKEVQQAIHANTNLGYSWSTCSPRVNYSRTDLLASMIPVYENLAEHGVRMLVYSGDQDGIVATPGTRLWLSHLNFTITEPWRPYTVNDQVGGYVTGYDKLTFATVRGAGHMVPYTQQSRAYHMFTNFIAGKPL